MGNEPANKKFDIEQLKNMLAVVERVSVNNNAVSKKLHAIINDCKILSQEDKDCSYWGKLNLTDYNIWRTPIDCREFDFLIDVNGDINVNARIYNSIPYRDYINLKNEFGNNRLNIRAKFTLVVPDAFILEISDDIKSAFDKELEYQYEEYLENQKKEWINLTRKKYMESFKAK